MNNSSVIQVRAIPNARKNEIKKEGKRLKAYLMAPPAKGKANRLLLELLAQYLDLRKSRLKIIKGEKARDKTILIEY